MPKKPKPASAYRPVAEAIARHLFTDHGEQVAVRLAMKHVAVGWTQETEGSGWCEQAVADVIEDHLICAANTAAHGND